MRLSGVPVFLWLIGCIGLMMAAPALLALMERDWRSARLFVYAGTGVVFAAAILAAAARRPVARGAQAREELLTFLGLFSVAPLFAAAPLWLVRPDLGVDGAVFMAVSAMTTTGASLFDRPQDVPRAVHLWLSLTGWTGGLLTLAAAAAVLSPRGLVGTPDTRAPGPEAIRAGRVTALGPGGPRAMRAMRWLLPVYAALTAALAVALSSAGVEGFVAICHAMAAVSTSGISPLADGMAGQGGGRAAEAMVALVMIAGASRLVFERRATLARLPRAATRDPELRLMALAVAVAGFWIFLRHAWGASTLTLGGASDPYAAFAAAWGALITAIGFVTTTGFVSADWAGARDWSGLEAPGMMALGLAVLGGGVASTAGGVKLFRAYALFQLGATELARLPHPSVVEAPRGPRGRLGRELVTGAWVFVMLFMAAAAAALLALTASGVAFERAVPAAFAALANAGPAFPVAVGDPAAWTRLDDAARWVACAAMVLGRIEVLVLVALLDPRLRTG